MSTALDIINRSLVLIGANSPLNPAPAETLNSGVVALRALINEWLIEDFRIGATPPENTASEINELTGSTAALEYGLAFRMAPIVQRPVPPEVRTQGTNSIRIAREKWQYTPPDRRPGVPWLYYGAGNKRRRSWL